MPLNLAYDAEQMNLIFAFIIVKHGLPILADLFILKLFIFPAGIFLILSATIQPLIPH